MISDLQQQFFDTSSNQYDLALLAAPPVHTKQEIAAIMKRLAHLPKETLVIDFGAGSGRVSIPLLKKGFSVLAIDVSTKSLENLQRAARKLTNKMPQVAKEIPNHKQFEAIVGADILHHINLTEYLPHFYKSLKPGGIAIFSEPNAFNLAWYAYLPFASSWEVEKGMIHSRYFKLKRLFRIAGFSSITITGHGLLPTPLFTWSQTLCKLNDAAGNLPFLKLFSYRYIIEAKK